MLLMATKKYDLVVLGATGYTGKFCAEYITTNLPINVKWAIAGRSEQKLSKVLQELKVVDPDRTLPCSCYTSFPS